MSFPEVWPLHETLLTEDNNNFQESKKFYLESVDAIIQYEAQPEGDVSWARENSRWLQCPWPCSQLEFHTGQT